jgi:excisionase family DNA binding protein
MKRSEAAKRLRVSVSTVKRYERAGLLDAVRVGPKLKFITEESVERMLRGGEDDAE